MAIQINTQQLAIFNSAEYNEYFNVAYANREYINYYEGLSKICEYYHRDEDTMTEYIVLTGGLRMVVTHHFKSPCANVKVQVENV